METGGATTDGGTHPTDAGGAASDTGGAGTDTGGAAIDAGGAIDTGGEAFDAGGAIDAGGAAIDAGDAAIDAGGVETEAGGDATDTGGADVKPVDGVTVTIDDGGGGTDARSSNAPAREGGTGVARVFPSTVELSGAKADACAVVTTAFGVAALGTATTSTGGETFARGGSGGADVLGRTEGGPSLMGATDTPTMSSSSSGSVANRSRIGDLKDSPACPRPSSCEGGAGGTRETMPWADAADETGTPEATHEGRDEDGAEDGRGIDGRALELIGPLVSNSHSAPLRVRATLPSREIVGTPAKRHWTTFVRPWIATPTIQSTRWRLTP